ncbi:MAG: phospholipase D-like domain-containing protein [Pseudomonadota bacterium]
MADKHPPSRPARLWRKLRNRPLKSLLFLVVLVYLGTAIGHVYKPLPEGLNADYPPRAAEDVDFLVDATWIAADRSQQQNTEIFERVIELVNQAEQLVVVEMFLLNEFAGASGADHRPLSSMLLDALIQKKAQRPGMTVVLIVDPFNRLYGGVEAPALDEAEAAGVEVIETRLSALPDSNPVWSGIWRLCCRFLGNSTEGWLPNPVGGESVSLRTYLTLLNFKANHRKSLVVDQGTSWTGLVTTGNAHDASSRHSNVGVVFSGAAAIDLLETMRATARFSGVEPDWPIPEVQSAAGQSEDSLARVLSEVSIREVILELIDDSLEGERLDLALFYLSQRDIIESIAAAHRRGVDVRLLMDPNEDAFGRKKDGVPNRQVALELHDQGIPIRWCNTRGEQCHYKHLLHIDQDQQASLLVGSANYTRRNLDGFNLETQVLIEASADHAQIIEAARFFDQRWSNEGEREHSLPYAAYEDTSRWRYWRYRFMEATGLSTF